MALIHEEGTNRLQISKFRIYSVYFVVVLFMALLIGRLLWIQILYPEKLIAEGNARVLRNYNYEPPRGLITDRNGKILAISVPVKSVDADPLRLHELGIYQDKKKMQQIADILQLDLNLLYKRTADPAKRFVHLKHYLDLKLANKLKKIAKDGLILTDTYRRHYPTGEMNSALIGFLNGEGVGVYGVEQSFNNYLTAIRSTRVAKKDRYDHIVENLATLQKGANGGNLVLSIDNRLQEIAYSCIKNTVVENDADSGMAILMDVKSGEILSLVNYPSFDPNERGNIDLSNARNRAISDIFEPGSTMKPIVALAALEAKATNWREVINCRPFVVDGKMVKDSHAMNEGTIADIIKFSSNTGMAHLAMRIGPQKILQVLDRFGFGQKSGSGLVGESSGKLNENRKFWADIDKATLGFGYGMAVTNLQLASAYATIANGGFRYKASILRLSKVPEPEPVASQKEVERMKNALESVVSAGTGGKAAIDRYRVAGKTGTAKVATKGGYGDSYVATFAGFAPISNPRFSLVVVVNRPKAGKFYGGVVSGPAFSEIMARALQLYNIKPDNPLTDAK